MICMHVSENAFSIIISNARENITSDYSYMHDNINNERLSYKMVLLIFEAVDQRFLIKIRMKIKTLIILPLMFVSS